jgi:hypothetical protein
LTSFEQLEIVDSTRTYYLGDLAFNDFTGLRFAHLIANCYSVTGLD